MNKSQSQSVVRIMRAQRGFTLVEIIIALALVGVVMAGVLFYQSRAENSQRVNDAVQAIITMAGSIKRVYAPANSYSDVSSSAVINAGIVIKPFSVSGSGSSASITDPWGATVTVGGSAPFFGFAFNAPNSEACMQIVSALADNAVRITVNNAITTAPFSSTATSAPLFLPAGTVVKGDATSSYNAGNAATGCSATTARYIGVVFR